MTLTPENIAARLAPRPARFYQSVGSTQDIGHEWLRGGAASGSVVVAEEQTSGRGRKGRGWYAPPGTGIALTVILRPQKQALRQMSMLGALTVVDVCEHVGAHEVGVKWPNDVQVGGLKVCGILPEAEWEGERLLGVVLGMGLNVRIDFRGTELEDKAISLETTVARRLDRLDLLAVWLERVDFWAARLGSDELFAAWRARLNMLGGPVSIATERGLLHGIAEDVDASGMLLLRDATGVQHRLMAGDIELGSEG